MILDWQSVSALVFVVVLSALLINARKRISVQGLFPVFYFVMYKTKLGLSTMNSWAKKYPRSIHVLAMTGIGVGFLGMGFIVVEIIRNAVQLITTPSAAAGVQLVLPIQAKGVFFVPFLYWLISIFVIAVVHEFSHGVVARRYNVPVKSSGFAFLGILAPIVPAAFVEPDEKVLIKKPLKQQLGVFAAGPFANILLAFALLLVLWLVVTPAENRMLAPPVPIIDGVTPQGPLALAGVHAGETVLSIDSQATPSVQELAAVLKTKKPGDHVALTTTGGEYAVILAGRPDAVQQAFLGVEHWKEQSVYIPELVQRWSTGVLNAVRWVFDLLAWLFLLSLGIGMFNLLPLGPIDGGQMFRETMKKIFPNHGLQIWKFVSYCLLAILVFTLVVPWVR